MVFKKLLRCENLQSCFRL